jgi:hypothetical protein
MAFRADDRVSVQIHRYDLELNGQIVASQRPVIAVWIPSRKGLDWILNTNILKIMPPLLSDIASNIAIGSVFFIRE